MKKIMYVLAASALLAASCEQKPGYTIAGSVNVEGSADGDTVFLSKREGREMLRLDTALLAGGSFTFEGVQDSLESRHISVFSKEANRYVDHEFFLENGQIHIEVNKDGFKATGTLANDQYAAYREGLQAIEKQYGELYEAYADTTLTEAQRDEKREALNACGEQRSAYIMEQIEQHIASPIVVSLFRNHQMDVLFMDDMEKVNALLQQVPAAYADQPVIAMLKGSVEKLLNTAVGKPFTDFEMNTPEGKPMKISDYAGKQKAVLIDFWASWCGPCRAAMPELKKIYAEYHAKGFEIVGVSLDGQEDRWKAAIKDDGLTWPHMSDLKGWNCAGAGLYGVRSIPALVLIDAKGTIVARNIHGDELRKKLDELLK